MNLTPHTRLTVLPHEWTLLSQSSEQDIIEARGPLGAAEAYLRTGLPHRVFVALEVDEQNQYRRTIEEHWAIAQALYDTRRWAELETLCAEARSHHGNDASGLLQRILLRLAWARLRSGDLAGAQALADDVRAVSLREHGSLSVLGDLAHIDAFVAFRYNGDTIRALRLVDSAVAFHQHEERGPYLAKALILGSVILRASGLVASARTKAIEACEIAHDCAHVTLLRDALGQAAICGYRLGSLNDALQLVSDALILDTSPTKTEDPKYECTLELIRGRVLLRLGRLADTEQSLVKAESLSSAADDKLHAMVFELRGLLLIAQGEAIGALTMFQATLERLQQHGVQSYELSEGYLRRSEALVALNRFSQAYDDTTTALSLLDKAGEGLERGHVLRIKALAAYHMGRPKESRRLFIQSERELRRVGDLYELGRCLTDKAELAPRNEAESALADAAEAVNLFERVGVEPLAERARDIFAICHLRLQRAQHARSVLQQNSSKVIASSESMQAVLADCERAASRDVTVLITGETGVGKEVVARFVHDASARAQKNFVPVNCAAIPDSLFEREFFGHTKGAYTGADSDKPGLVEAADGGTLFLDEIGEMPLALQPKLLRLLQEGTYRRVGDVHEKKVSLRIVAATNRDLQDLVQEKTFREDLYYRLGWFRIAVPPLRERVDDMIDLTKMFLDRESLASGTIFWLQKETWTLFRRYSWPGNVRELEAAICSSIARADADGCIRVEHLPAEVREAMPRPHSSTLELQKHLDSQERELILRALRSADYQRARAARLLGIGRNTLYEKMKKFGIKPER